MNKYEQICQIGKGSFGIVYKCRIKRTGQFVALKLISTYGKSQAELDQLEKEIDLLKRMDHQFVMRVYEDFREDGNICIATELGQSDLFDVVQNMNYQILNEDENLLKKYTEKLQTIIAQTLAALVYLHGQKIAHRDIKPQNILLCDGVCKLADFGFAKQIQTALTSLKGSPIYLAPEIAKQRPYNFQADIWSLGIMAFELITGSPPFIASDQMSLIKFLSEDKLQAPFQDYPIFQKLPKFQNFIEMCLQKNPDKRPNAQLLLKHPFITNVKMRIEVNSNYTRDWKKIIEYQISNQEQQDQQEQIEQYKKDVIDKFANVNVQEVFQDSSKVIEDLSSKSYALKLIIDIFKQHGRKVDFKFQSQDMKDLIQDELLMQDYLSLKQKKIEDDEFNYEVLHDKLDFLFYFILKYQSNLLYQIIIEISNFRTRDLDPKQRRTLILLMRILCGFLGCTISFRIPLIFGEVVSFPNDVYITYDDLKIPKVMEDKIEFTQRIHLQYAMINVFNKPKQVVDMLEILINLLKENSLRIKDKDEFQPHTHLLYLFLTSIQALFGLAQCLYTNYILFIPSSLRIIETQNEISGEIHKSLNYDVNIFDTQRKVMPNLGKKLLPSYLLSALKEEEKQTFLSTFDQDQYFFRTLPNIDDKLDMIIDIMSSLNRHYRSHFPSLAIVLYKYIRNYSGFTETASINNIIDEAYQTFIKQMSNQIYKTEDRGTNVIQSSIDHIDQLFDNIKSTNELDTSIDITMLRYQLATTTDTIKQVYEIILPLLITKNGCSDKQGVQLQLTNIQFSKLLQQQQDEDDDVTSIEYIVKNISQDDFQQLDILNAYKPYLSQIICMLPFVRQFNIFQTNTYDSQSLKYIQLEQEKSLLYDFTRKSISMIISSYYRVNFSSIPMFEYMVKDLTPNQEVNNIQVKLLEQYKPDQEYNGLDDITNPQYKSLAQLLIQTNLPCRLNYVFQNSQMASSFSLGKSVKQPMYISYQSMPITGNNIIKVSYFYVSNQIIRSGQICNIAAQAFQFGMINCESNKIRVVTKILTGQINQHLAISNNSQLLTDFLYQAIPCCVTDNIPKNEQEYYQSEYIRQNQFRIQIIQLLSIISQNKDGAKQIIKLQYQLDNCSDTISFISLLFCSSLWLQALSNEEDARIYLLLNLLNNDTDNLIQDCIEQDCETLKKHIQIKKDQLKSLYIIDYFIVRLSIYVKYVAFDVKNSQEKFEYIFNAIQKLDNELFSAEIDQKPGLTVVEDKFKYPKFYLSTGTSIRLPIVNSIKENEIGLNLVCLYSDILSQLYKNKELSQQLVYKQEVIQQQFLEYLVTIIDCFIVEYPVFSSVLSGQLKYGFLDGIIDFMSRVQDISEIFIILLNKISVILNLQQRNSLLEAWQATYCQNHHPDKESANNSQIFCSRNGCLTCLYNMNGARLEDSAYYRHIVKLNQQQVNRNYQNVYWHWNYLISQNGFNNYIKIIQNIQKFYQKQLFKENDQITSIQMLEISRVLTFRLNPHYVKQVILTQNQQEAESMIVQIIHTLFNFDQMIQNRAKFYESLIEYNVVQNILNSMYYIKIAQSLQTCFGFIQHLVQCDQQHTSQLFCYQYVMSGALSIDYMSTLFSEQFIQMRDSPIGSIISILSQIARCSRNFTQILQGSLVPDILLKIFDLKSLKTQVLNLFANLCLQDQSFVRQIDPFHLFAIEQLKNSQSETKMVIQCIHLIKNSLIWSDYYVERVSDNFKVFVDLLNWQSETGIRCSVVGLFAVMSKHSILKQKIQGIQIEQYISDIIQRTQVFTIQMQPLITALNQLKTVIGSSTMQKIIRKLKIVEGIDPKMLIMDETQK
ncbi:Kinase [Hexamita inflata]|uniref:non-specific serine/threonine protein kinase n=1 Tax=Hexamita inflata TaxID=28002 RepID=A0AA86RID9_9EUKA|nr:Kinase [Hexamita inflata]